jgi:hypothetical protein
MANGLTCVLAPELTRQAVFEALRERRCYGTTGPRIHLSFEMEGQPMGSVLSWREKARVRASVVGTAPLESLALHRGRELIHEVRPEAFQSLAGSRRVRVSWGGARMRGPGRRVTWNGHIRLDGVRLMALQPFALDTATDRIVDWGADRVEFCSRTTGDRDGVDLWLDQAACGNLFFESRLGSCVVALEQLHGAANRKVFDLGGLGLEICVERYPERLIDLSAALDCEVHSPADRMTPYLVKAVQSDAHMAWSSPIYIG